MGFLKDITPSSLLSIDTNLFAYYFEDDPDFAPNIEKLFTFIFDNHIRLVQSPLLLTELLTLPYKRQQQQHVEFYENLEVYFPHLRWQPFLPSTALLAAELRAQHNLRTPDAMHLATAIEAKADFFLTADKRIKKLTEITVQVIESA